MVARARRRIHLSVSDRAFDIVNYTLVGIATLTVLYPLVFVISASFSDPYAVYQGRVWLLPNGFTLEGYEIIFTDRTIWMGYWNTIVYTVTGTTINVVLTVLTGYALAQRNFLAKNLFTVIFVVTMFFSGGLIPLYLLVRRLGMLNTIWALVIPNALSMWNIIIARTYFSSSIPEELRDAAFVEGANHTRFLLWIVLPLSKALVAVLILFYGVGHWNSYFNALIYLSDRDKYPLQLVLRGILVQSQTLATMFDPDNAAFAQKMQRAAELIKFGVIVVASAPLLILYPFLQKYFVKGVLIGSLKG